MVLGGVGGPVLGNDVDRKVLVIGVEGSTSDKALLSWSWVLCIVGLRAAQSRTGLLQVLLMCCIWW